MFGATLKLLSKILCDTHIIQHAQKLLPQHYHVNEGLEIVKNRERNHLHQQLLHLPQIELQKGHLQGRMTREL